MKRLDDCLKYTVGLPHYKPPPPAQSAFTVLMAPKKKKARLDLEAEMEATDADRAPTTTVPGEVE